MPPQTMKAIKILPGEKAELQDVPFPQLRPGYVLCKVKCVALNPTDWKHIDGDGGRAGSTVGSDFCGVVEQVGDGVQREWKQGDRIAAFVHGGNDTHPGDGTFAEYCLAKGDVAMKVPDSISDENAASLGVSVITCGQALYQSLGLPLPGSGKSYGGYLLVYGGSSGTGIFAIQYAVLSGCKVVATASERNWPLLKSLGASEVFDYKDPDCGKKIREYTNDSLTLALDCISEGDSAQICEQAVSSRGGAITYLLRSAPHSRKDVVKKHTSGYTVFGEAFDKLGEHVPAKPQDFEHCKKFWQLTEELVAEGRLKPHPMKVGGEGLVGVFDGMQQAREGKVSGVKLVYRVEETPGLR
ncbi:putative zinc-binding oxidoreductase ToxD [Neohortaea acidophila]|uniref:Putative zinc-binding oxidoreductase ToxD n=1 Tax=Neohortaea acidophila TaxID=245834 RepID=A0A6A6PQL1_9PEZI|nr:putative zinc-binding oxidoreductase ToxD [Neohortaea acidophila]KAF2481971.1 putative zinc-binding oxidoreductase ToxD [Neohortaea acidophila]